MDRPHPGRRRARYVTVACLLAGALFHTLCSRHHLLPYGHMRIAWDDSWACLVDVTWLTAITVGAIFSARSDIKYRWVLVGLAVPAILMGMFAAHALAPPMLLITALIVLPAVRKSRMPAARTPLARALRDEAEFDHRRKRGRGRR